MQLIQFAGVPEEKPANAASVPHSLRRTIRESFWCILGKRKIQFRLYTMQQIKFAFAVGCVLNHLRIFMKPHTDSEDGYFPILIEYSTGQQQVCKTVNDVPCGVTFKVIETNYQSEVCQ